MGKKVVEKNGILYEVTRWGLLKRVKTPAAEAAPAEEKRGRKVVIQCGLVRTEYIIGPDGKCLAQKRELDVGVGGV